MFPFQQNNNEFSTQNIFSYPCQDFIQEDPILGQDYLDSTTNLVEELPSSVINNDAILASNEKKIIRKEIERQRRQQISTLHASLRSLLPLESLKGKRSMSDHIDEAAKYIKHLQNNVQGLSVKRDKLNNLSNFEQGNYESSKNMLSNGAVTVRSHLGGVEIVVSWGSGEHNFLLSRVLGAVVEEGFDVVSCIFTKRDQGSYSTIQCQASDLTCIDLPALHQKLKDVMLF